MHVEIAMASGATVSGAKVGIVADDHAGRQLSRRGDSVHRTSLYRAYVVLPDRHASGPLKMDIEGGEFASSPQKKT